MKAHGMDAVSSNDTDKILNEWMAELLWFVGEDYTYCSSTMNRLE